MPSFHRDCILESGALPRHLVRVPFLSFGDNCSIT